MSNITKNIEAKLNEGLEAITLGARQMETGAKLITECLDEDRQATLAFMKTRKVSEDFIDLIELVGRGRILPQLMFMPGDGPERLHKVTSLAEQERIINTGVEVARLVGDEFKKTVKPISEVTKAEAMIAINSSGQVPFEQQVEQIKRKMVHTTFKLPPFERREDEVYCRENCRIQFAELERLYLEAKPIHEQKLASLESGMKKNQIHKTGRT